MPTYEYQCKNCKHRFELFQSMKDAPKRKCPECGKNALERLIGTGAAVLFKGSGFYQTDYRSESYKKAAESETKSTTGTKTDGAAASTASPSSSSSESGAKTESAPKKEPSDTGKSKKPKSKS